MTNFATQICKVGDRIECCRYFGTVKYVGEIEGKPATWLGIDWDDPERGKHAGSLNGIKYFTTKHPTSGSFIRPEKVDFGRSVISSIQSRYGQGEDEFTAKINQQNQLLIQQTMNAPFLEMVGFDKVFTKQSNFSALKVVNLRDQSVSSVGPVEELARTCPNITELDLSKNLLSCWSSIFDICAHLENLTWINVSENIMKFPENFYELRYSNINTLICGTMGLNWGDILNIGLIFPNLEELITPFNDIRSLDEVENRFQALKMLDLEGNVIEDWNEILKLNSIKTLEHLNLENIGLTSIEFGDGSGKVEIFRNLKKLCVVNNFIHEWKSMSELNRLESLEYLKVSKNPVFQSEDNLTIYQLLIARIANVKVLNGVEIEASERRGAEYDYIKKYGLEWLAVKGTSKEEHFLKSHGRYMELIQKYGEPEEAELLVKPKIIQSSLVRLKLTFNDKALIKRLPPTITIQKLIMMVQKLFRLKDRPSLTYVSSSDSKIEIELNDELKEIGVYSMQDDDEIVIKL